MCWMVAALPVRLRIVSVYVTLLPGLTLSLFTLLLMENGGFSLALALAAGAAAGATAAVASSAASPVRARVRVRSMSRAPFCRMATVNQVWVGSSHLRRGE